MAGGFVRAWRPSCCWRHSVLQVPLRAEKILPRCPPKCPCSGQVPPGCGEKTLAKVRKIRAGWFHSLALLEDGSLRAWGFNHDRQTEIPKNLPPVADITAGAAQTMVLLTNGDVRVWGSDDCGLVSTGNKLRGIKAIASGANHCIALGKDGIHLWGQNCFGQTSRPGIEGEVVAVFAGENTTGVILAQPESAPQP